MSASEASMLLYNIEVLRESKDRLETYLAQWVRAEYWRRPAAPNDGYSDTWQAWVLGIADGKRPPPSEWPTPGTVGGAFKGVLWDRGTVTNVNGCNGYKAAVVGVAIFDSPLSFHGRGEAVLYGSCAGLFSTLEKIPRGRARYKLGTADAVLTNLDHAIISADSEDD